MSQLDRIVSIAKAAEPVWDAMWSSDLGPWWYGNCTSVSLLLAPILRSGLVGGINDINVIVGYYHPTPHENRKHCWIEVDSVLVVDPTFRQWEKEHYGPLVSSLDHRFSNIALLSPKQEEKYRRSIKLSEYGKPGTDIKKDFWCE